MGAQPRVDAAPGRRSAGPPAPDRAPGVAAGVDEHSDFRADPWRRLAGTLKSYLTIVYGTGPVARAEIRRLNALHRGIVGAGYSARDPELSLWVHATLVDSTLVANDRWIEPLSRERRERAYDETRPIGRAFGVPEALLPTDLDAFEAYVAGMLAPDGPVKPGPLARDLAERDPAPAAGAACSRRPRHSSTASRRRPTAGRSGRRSGCCRPSVREAYGFAWGPRERAGLGLARGRLACLATAHPANVAPDAEGPGRGRAPRRRRRLARYDANLRESHG